MKKVIKLSILAMCLISLLVGCSGNGNNSQNNLNTENTQINQVKTYTVSISDNNGVSLADVDVSIYSNNTLKELVATGITNGNGVAAFTLNESADYVVRISGLSDNYMVDEEFQFEDRTLNIVLSYQPHQQSNPDEEVDIGDKVYNYSFKNTDGSEFLLYDVLSKKKLVILEFTLGRDEPSQVERSFLENIYQFYQKDIEIIEIEYNSNSMITRAFKIMGYPTTVYISHDGIIKNIEGGRFETEEEYRNLIDKLISEQ